MDPDKSVFKNLVNMKVEDIADKVESSEKTVDDKKKSKKRRARILSSYDEENDTLLKKGVCCFSFSIDLFFSFGHEDEETETSFRSGE